MVVVESISNGLRMSLKREFLLPFFLLNVLVGLSFLTLLFPIIDKIPNMLLRFEVRPILLNFLIAITVYILYKLTLLWFNGSVISTLSYGGSFERNLVRVKRALPSLIILGILLLLIHGTLGALSYSFPMFSFIFRIASFLLNVLLMFTAMGIVIKRDPVEIGMFRSVHLVRKNPITSLAFLILNNLVNACIILFGVFLSLPFLLPTFFEIAGYFKSYELIEIPEIFVLQNIVRIMKEHYFEFIATMLILSFFLSIQMIFDVASKTTLFLRLMKRRSEVF